MLNTFGHVKMCELKNWMKFYVALWCVTSVLGIYISNLNDSCIRCLCHVVGCDTAQGCSEGYCGPFYISRAYWADAGKPTLPDDDPERRESFEDCARNYHCSANIVVNYMARFGKDCNKDGHIDCYDYYRIHKNGGYGCDGPLDPKFETVSNQCIDGIAWA